MATAQTLLFEFPATLKPLVSSWANETSLFYSQTLTQVDPDLAKDWITPEIQARTSTTPVSGIDDTLENLVVYFSVQLILLLGHETPHLRVDAALHLIKLCSLVNPQLQEPKLVPIVSQLQAGPSLECLHSLVTILGGSLSIMLVPLVSGLENYQMHHDWRIRSISNTSISRLVFDAQDKNLYKSPVWNIYFALGSLQSSLQLFQDRLVMIQALHLLAPVYTPKDSTLALGICDTLMRLPSKTATETDEIKATLTVIFQTLYKSKPDTPPDYAFFLNILNTSDEASLDLLAWALELFLRCGTTATEKTVAPFKWQIDFAQALTNHFRAGPAIVRYGTAICLHTIVEMSPGFLEEHKYLYMYVIAGLLDTDHATAYMYESMLQLVQSPNAQQLQACVQQIHRAATQVYTYDQLYVNVPALDHKDSGQSQLLSLIAKQTPPVASLLLHKMANAIEYMSVPMKARQLQVISYLGQTAEKLDSYLMQVLVPLCTHQDTQLQQQALKVVRALMPGFMHASAADVAFVWSYIHPLLSIELEPNMLTNALEVLRSFPVLQLSSVLREELIQALFRLTFYPDPLVRMKVYQFFGESLDYWKTCDELPRATSILFQALGDHDPRCLRVLVDNIVILGGTVIIPITSALTALREATSKSALTLIKAYDNLCIALAVHKPEMRALVDALCNTERADKFWSYYLEDVQENQLAKPDEYDYSRNYVQAPYWISLLCTKFNILPPPPQGSEFRRDQVPMTIVGKRRFACGFTFCLFPSMGMSEPNMRYASCVAAVRCCFKQNNVQPTMLRSLLEIATQQMLSSKKTSYQLSALDILGLVVRLKVPGVSESILLEYIDLCIDFLHNTPSPLVKIEVLQFVEILMLVFPKGINNKIEEIRDVTRLMLVDSEKQVVDTATRVYLLVFRCTVKNQSEQFESYLKQELDAVMNRTKLENLGDPYVNDLTADQAELLTCLLILGSGQLKDSVIPPYEKAQRLFLFLQHPNAAYRACALSSALSLISSMDAVFGTAVLWVLLPLFADPNPYVRAIFCRFQQNIPDLIESHCATIIPHVEDNFVLPAASWSDTLTDSATLQVSQKFLNDLNVEFSSLNLHPFSLELSSQDDGFHLPRISPKLLQRMRSVSETLSLNLPAEIQSQVLYHLHSLEVYKPLQPAVILSVSLFLSWNENLLADQLGTLISYLVNDITPENRNIVEGSILALKHISESSNSSFKQVLQQLTQVDIPNQGGLYCLISLLEYLRDQAPQKAPELVTKYLNMVSDHKTPLKNRILSLHIGVELALMCENDEIKTAFDCAQELLGVVEDFAMRYQIYNAIAVGCRGRDPKHPLLKILMTQAKKEIYSKTSKTRKHGMMIFSIFFNLWQLDERMAFLFRLLADPDHDIRISMRNSLIKRRIVDLDTLLGIQGSGSALYDTFLRSGQLPVMRDGGMALSGTSSYLATIPQLVNDPYNIEYYQSTKFKSFFKMYGLPDTLLQKMTNPLTTVMIDSIDTRYDLKIQTVPQKYHELLNTPPVEILSRLIETMPRIAMEIVDEVQNSVQIYLAGDPNGEIDPSERNDLEAAIHVIEVFTTLIIAHKGSGERFQDWIQQLQTCINTAVESCKQIRESMMHELERTFFFYSFSSDIPITSDEQALALDEIVKSTQDATLEILKSGKADQLAQLDSRREEFSQEMDHNNQRLVHLTTMTLHLISGLGVAFGLSRAGTPEQLDRLLKFFIKLLDEEHRTMREAATEAIILIANIHMERPSKDIKDQLVPKLDQLSAELIQRLQGKERIFRKKKEYLNLLGQLMTWTTDVQTKRATLRLLVDHWTDPDSEVRKSAIQMVKNMGENGIKEISDMFTAGSDGIMTRASKLMNNPDFLDKEALLELLKWKFQ
ncbi:armadillo-type protein [Gorgonomyces haynaldii]|nr:armadillo-type protein [Gorgonomyces haynaldii]